MKVVSVERSSVDCTEADWYGIDVTLDVPITQEFIYKLETIGDLFYIPDLKEPFFKVCNKSFVLTGFEGRQVFRFGCKRDYLNLDDVVSVDAFLSKVQSE